MSPASEGDYEQASSPSQSQPQQPQPQQQQQHGIVNQQLDSVSTQPEQSKIKRESNSIHTLSISALSEHHVHGTIEGVPVDLLVDTGAAVTVMNSTVWDEVSRKQPTKTLQATQRGLIGVQGKPLDVRGVAELTIQLCAEEFPTQVMVVDSLSSGAILGRDFLRVNNCLIDMEDNVLQFKRRGFALSLTSGERNQIARIAVTLKQPLHVPGSSEIDTMGVVPVIAESHTWILERPAERSAGMVARAVVTPQNRNVPVRICNPREEKITIPKGTTIAILEPIEEEPQCIAEVQEKDKNCTETKQRMLWEIATGTNAELTDGERDSFYGLLLEYADIFAGNQSDYGRTDIVQHRIFTGDHPPIRQQVRRLPPSRRNEVKQLLQEMQENNVIQPSNSPWASPIVLVRKKDGSTRFCVDFRKVNATTRKDAYPLPRVEDTLDALTGSKWFTTLDLISGYWQVEVDPKDREKTAFCTTEGLFEFRVMPFGLCNAPATFQRLMDTALAGEWQRSIVYIDDIIIPGRTFREHLNNLAIVFQRLREAGLKLKPIKCAFCKPKVTFLGHVLSGEGVATDPAKTEKVATWPVPTSHREVQQFLGLANYYRRFVRDYAKVAKPLHRLTEKTMQFQWSQECQDAFTRLRNELVSTPILAFPDYDKEFILDTDASNDGIGAVLSQIQESGEEKVIAYGSRVLSKPERRYCVTRRELLAVVTFTRHFRHYLLGRHFTLRTDHGSLRWLQNFKEPEGQFARWIEKLQEYEFTIIHRPGKSHGNADALSRLPCKQCGRKMETSEELLALQAIDNSLAERTPAEIRQLQLDDPTIGPVVQAKEQDVRLPEEEAKKQSLETRRLLQLWDQLEAEEPGSVEKVRGQ